MLARSATASDARWSDTAPLPASRRRAFSVSGSTSSGACSGAVSDPRASDAVADLASTNLRRYPHAPLRDRVWELRAELTAYDATYLALAEALGDSVLVTSDARLAERSLSSLGPDRVLHVG